MIFMAAAFCLLAGNARAGSGPASMEARHLAQQLMRLKPRVPKVVFEELEAYHRRWESLNWEDRQYLEKCMVTLDSMLPHQIREYFNAVAKAKGDEGRKLAKKALKALAGGGEVPAANVNPSVVVVVVGGNVLDPKTGFGDSKKQAIPRIWNEIRPYGAFVPSVRTMWVANRTMWIGEFLTGISVKSIVADGNVYKFKYPTLCDLYRKISGIQSRDCWIATRGDENNIIYDFLEFQRDFEDKYKPTAITGAKLRGIDDHVQDHIHSQRKDGKTGFQIQQGLRTTLTPGKLHLDVDFDSQEVQKFLKDVIAEHGGQLTDSDAYLHRLGVRLLQDPVMAPRLAIIRFGGIAGIQQVKNLGTKKAMMNQKMRDDDERCFNLWRAFRSNPYYRQFGTFIVVSEFGGAVFVGPKIKVGTTSKSYYLNQFAATIAKILGYDVKDFFAPQRSKPKSPIKEIFEEE
jgi:hypothetical protein